LGFLLGDLMRSKIRFFSDFDSSDGILAEDRGIPLALNVGAFSDEQAHFLEYHRAKVFRVA
jgi:hypothetical protein